VSIKPPGTESEAKPLEVDVIVKLKHPAESIDGLNVRRTIGQIVTGTVALDKIEAVRSSPNVISLKAATRSALE